MNHKVNTPIEGIIILTVGGKKQKKECVLFSFPGENKIFNVINFCILIAKYYIYIQKLINSNKIDFYDFLVQLKQKLQIENIICIDKGNPSKFEQF